MDEILHQCFTCHYSYMLYVNHPRSPLFSIVFSQFGCRWCRISVSRNPGRATVMFLSILKNGGAGAHVLSLEGGAGFCPSTVSRGSFRRRHTDRPTDWPTDRPTGLRIARPADRPTDRRIERPIERPIGRRTDRLTVTPTCRPTFRAFE